MKINFKFLLIVFFLSLFSINSYAEDNSKRGSVGLQIGGLVKFPDAGTFGATVSEVLPNGPAANAGIKALDVIISLNGEYFKNESDFKKLSLVTAGIPVKFGLVRDSKVISVQLTPLAQQPSQEQPKAGELTASDSSSVSKDLSSKSSEMQHENVSVESEKDKIQYDDYQARHNEYLARKAEGNKINGPRDIVNAAERNEQKEEAAQPTQNSGGNWLFFVGIFLTLFFGGAPWLLPWVDKKKALK
jgi:membrane-associated protease RseP (regulator of RpoE activity)